MADGTQATRPARVQSKRRSDEPATLLNTRVLRRLYDITLRARILRRAHDAAVHDAVLAGITVRLKPTDLVVTSADNAILEQLRPSRPGPQPADAPRNVLIAHAPAAGLGVASGLALAWRVQRGSNVVLWLGRAERRALDDWHQVMRSAGEMSLPIIFVVDASRKGPPVAAEPFGFPTINVDAGDPIAVYRVTEEAIKRARRRLGATLIACIPWKKTDPLALLEGYLRSSRHWSPKWAEELQAKYEREYGTKRKR